MMLNKAIEEQYDGPWSYRSKEFDDWGFVRSASGGVVCQVRLPYATQEELSEHRENKTDPWEKFGRLVRAAPEMYAMLKSIATSDGQFDGKLAILQLLESIETPTTTKEVAGDAAE